MSPKAQQIAIEKACGWARREWVDRKGRPCKGWKTPDGRELGGHPPDYLSDLNAMNEAENHLTKEQCYIYINHLIRIFGDWKPKDGVKNWIFHATASQRAEAFLRTLNLWDDTK